MIVNGVLLPLWPCHQHAGYIGLQQPSHLSRLCNHDHCHQVLILLGTSISYVLQCEP